MSPAANEGLTSRWQTIHALNSVSEVSEIISRDLELGESDLGGIYFTSQMQSEFGKMKKSLKEALNNKKADGIESDDSLIWSIDWTDPFSGVSVRKALYYDKLTGIALF